MICAVVFWTILWSSFLLQSAADFGSSGPPVSCPCSNASLCDPISSVPDKEVLGFVVDKDNWKNYNWTHITTLAMFTEFSQDLICFAHSKGVRVVLSGNYPIAEMVNAEKATMWIQSEVARVTALHADGYNIDIEDPIRSGTIDAMYLTAFVSQFSRTLKEANEKYQLSMDVAWSPNCIDERCYDVQSLSEATDFLVVMSYDERSQIRGPCIASANSALQTTASGLVDYIDLDIDPSILVMGVPWYGYDYPCLNLSSDDLCSIKAVPFRGVNCSDAAAVWQRIAKTIATQARTYKKTRGELMAATSGALKGSTLFITGASRGIGKAIALRAARDGANIVIAAKTATAHPKLPGTIYTAAKEVEEAGGQCLPCVVDIRDEAQIQSAVDQAVQKFGGIDILVNNASAIHLTGTVDTPMKKYDLMMNINTRGTFLTSKLCIPHLKKGKNPHILNISPPINLNPRWFASHCAYTMAKYGMSLCVLGMAEELKNDGIAVNALWPKTGISTAALEMLGGDEMVRKSRKPEIMSDAAYEILIKTGCQQTGQFLVDEDVLRSSGVTDMEQYSNVPGADLVPDYFLDVVDESFHGRMSTQAQPSGGGSAESSASMDTPEGVFNLTRTLINEEVVKQVNATFLFDASGKHAGQWLMDLKNGAGSVTAAQPGTEADVLMKCDSEDLVAMFKGKLSPTMAFMGGKLKITGNMGAAMKLEKLMGQVKSKL